MFRSIYFLCASIVEEVGILNTEDERENLHCVGVKLFGEVIGFELGKDGISQPCILRGADLEANEEFTDFCDLIIGGNHSEIHPERESPLHIVEQCRRGKLRAKEQVSRVSLSGNFVDWVMKSVPQFKYRISRTIRIRHQFLIMYIREMLTLSMVLVCN